MSTKETKGYTPYNVTRLVMWKYDEDTETYGDAIEIEGTIMSYKDSISTSSAELYGAGNLIDIATAKNKGTLEIGVAVDFRGENRKNIFGEVFESNLVNITTSSDVVPTVAVAVMSVTTTGKVNLRKWKRVMFNPNDEEVKQMESSATFATATVTGTYFPDEDDRMRIRVDHIDPTAKKDLIEKWFTDAEYIGIDEETTEETTSASSTATTASTAASETVTTETAAVSETAETEKATE